MPILKIVKQYEEIIIELEEKDEPVINITEEEPIQSNLCDTYLGEDPWGGCPIAVGDIYSVSYYGAAQTNFDFNENVDSSWANYYVKFKGGDCVNASYSGECVDISNFGEGSGWSVNGDTTRAYDYLTIAGKITLIDDTASGIGKKCSSGNWFYVYKNSDCKS
jgi:hypothetical protein